MKSLPFVLLSAWAARLAVSFPTHDGSMLLTPRALHETLGFSELDLIKRALGNQGYADFEHPLLLRKRSPPGSPRPAAPADQTKHRDGVLTDGAQLGRQPDLPPVDDRIAKVKEKPQLGTVSDTGNPKIKQSWQTETGQNIAAAQKEGTRLDQPHEPRPQKEADQLSRTDKGQAFDTPEAKQMRKDRDKIESSRPADDKKTFTDEKKEHTLRPKPGEDKITTNQVSAKEQRKIEANQQKQVVNQARDQGKNVEHRLTDVPESAKKDKNIPARIVDSPERNGPPEKAASPNKTPPPINTGSQHSSQQGSPQSSKESSPEPPAKKQKLNNGSASPKSQSPSPSPPASPKPAPASPTTSQTSNTSTGQKRKRLRRRDLQAVYAQHVRAALQRRFLEALDDAVMVY